MFMKWLPLIIIIIIIIVIIIIIIIYKQEKSCLLIDMSIPTEKNTSVKVPEKLSKSGAHH